MQTFKTRTKPPTSRTPVRTTTEYVNKTEPNLIEESKNTEN